MSRSNGTPIHADTPLYDRVQAMQPWELIESLEREKLEVGGDETQLRARLLFRLLRRAYPERPMSVCEVGREDKWLLYARGFEAFVKAVRKVEETKLMESISSLKGPVVRMDSEKVEARPEPEKPSKAMIACAEIMNELFSSKHLNYAWIFYKPVDVKLLGLTDYLDIVKKPMDLGTIHQNMIKGMYSSISELAADVRLMLDNCYRYYDEHHDSRVSPFITMVEKFEAAFEEIYNKISDESSIDDLSLLTDSKVSGNDDTLPSEKEEATTTQCEQNAELKSTQETVTKLTERVQALEEELAQTKKRMESLEAAATEMKINEEKNQKAEEDTLNYRMKCAKLMNNWNWKLEKSQTIEHLVHNLRGFQKFSQISDRVLLDMLPNILPLEVKLWYCRQSKKFDSYRKFENALLAYFYESKSVI